MYTLSYWSKKIFQYIFFIFILCVLVFYMARLSPGDPLFSYYGDSAERLSTAQKIDAMQKLGLNEPIHTQFIRWISDAARGDFGISYKYKQSVMSIIKKMYKNTLMLGGLAYLLTFALALLLGIFCIIHEDSFIDRAICKIGVVTTCIPSFWTALVLILVFSINLSWLPTGGAYPMGRSGDILGRIRHLVLPISVLVLSHLWYYAYMVRNKLSSEIRKDYVLLCRTKGLSTKRIIFTHCLRNILPSYISIMAVSVPHIIAGTYVVEKVFSYPGLGTLSFESAKYHDYNMLMILCMITGILVVFVNMTGQIISEKIDPRMKYQRRLEDDGADGYRDIQEIQQ